MKSMHLFAGAGGGLLCDLILGHTPVCAVEWDPYCCAVLRERVADGWFPGMHVFEGDVRLFDASEWKGRVDCVNAGFPCQPHSVAGKRKGHADDRNLWPECVRVIGEIRPRWVFLENVPGIVSNRFIGTVLGDLARIGYDARWTVLGADQVGAPHRRDRWWCLAYHRREHGGTVRTEPKPDKPGADFHSERCGSDVADAHGAGCPIRRQSKDAHADPTQRGQDVADAPGQQGGRSIERTVSPDPGTDGQDVADGGWWETEPALGRVVDGMATNFLRRGWWEEEPDIGRVTEGQENRGAKLKGLGNGQVPLQAALAWKILMKREED